MSFLQRLHVRVSPQQITRLHLTLSSTPSCHTNHLHVLPPNINKPFLWPSSFPLAWQLHNHHPSPDILLIPPLHMLKPSQPRLSYMSPNPPTCVVPLIYSFLILLILVPPNESCRIFNSATVNTGSCLFVLSAPPYAGHTTSLLPYRFFLSFLQIKLPPVSNYSRQPSFTSLPH